MAKKKTATKKKPDGKKKVNKSAEIRQYKAANPKQGPTEIAKALTAKGIKVVPAQVSTVLNTAKKSTKKKRKTRTASPAANNGKSDHLSYSGLMEARRFVDSVGGADHAKQLVDAIAKLRG